MFLVTSQGKETDEKPRAFVSMLESGVGGEEQCPITSPSIKQGSEMLQPQVKNKSLSDLSRGLIT